ncbi:hypothetical protein EPN96_10335 [bacterium]|nr:MAG: hypothetical protein EPN96_10335 [bacterium]
MNELLIKKVAVDRDVLHLPFTERVLSTLPPDVPVEVREEGEEIPKGKTSLHLTRERGTFFKDCPCTPGAVGCGYRIFTLGFQCPFACSYCFLRFYAPDLPLTLYCNLEEAREEFRLKAAKLGRFRVGTGEFTDSLALDGITGHSRFMSELAKEFPDVLVELKTKSAVIEPLLACSPPRNVVPAWSVNPEAFATSDEPLAATLRERLEAAKKAVSAGLSVGFHFDPVIIHGNWREEYGRLIENLFDSAPPEKIAWISVGSLRFPRRFLDQWGYALRSGRIYFDEIIDCDDGKMRYFWPLRREAYRFFRERVGSLGRGKVPLYLCMEPKTMWESAFLLSPEEGEVEKILCGLER